MSDHDFSTTRTQTGSNASTVTDPATTPVAPRPELYTNGLSRLPVQPSAKDPSSPDGKVIQRKEFSPWPGQAGTDVPDTYKTKGDVISERVQRTGDPMYLTPMPSLVEFDPGTCVLTSTMDINFLPAKDATQRLPQKQFDELKRHILDIANEKLNGWVFIRSSGGKSCPCAGKPISVKIVAQEGSGEYSTDIELTKDSDRENAGNLAASSSISTIWHEMGHVVLGAPDEYYEAPRPKERVNESDWSIMASSGDFRRRAVMHARHFAHLANWLGRKFPQCSFEVVEASRPVVVDFSFLYQTGGFSGAGLTGVDFGTEFRIGIPLERQRHFRSIIGAYGDFVLGTKPMDRNAFMAGVLTGLEYSPSQSSGHLLLGADVRTGAANFNLDKGDWAPTIGTSGKIGYISPWFNAALAAGVGTPLYGVQKFNPYFNLGVNAAVSF